MRYIGIRHRIKKTAGGEARPTQVCIRTGGLVILVELKDEESELAFIHTLQAGDVLAMPFGGSGGYFAFAAARVAAQKSAQCMRIPPFVLKEKRGEADKEADATLLAELAESHPHLFFPVADRDRSTILLREQFFAWQEVMRARIACQQRLRQRAIGAIYTSSEGLFPEGGIEKAFDSLKANDPVLTALEREEAGRLREMTKTLESLEVYQKVFAPVVGIGPSLAARIMVRIDDIRLFATDAKLKAYLGVHVLPDGTFPRRRAGQVANWNDDARKALWLLAKQFNYRPESEWGIKLREAKKRLRVIHPVPVKNGAGKLRYTDGHIARMAAWRTVTVFVAKHVYPEWWAIATK